MDCFEINLIDNEEKPSFFNSSDSSKSSKQMYKKCELDPSKYLINDNDCSQNVETFKIQLNPITPSIYDGTKCPNLEKCNSDIFREYEIRQSLSRSNDSGLPHSGSCVSINSKKNKYHHIQSKVKKYINDIKNQQSLKNLKKLDEVNVIQEKNKIDEIDECHEEMHKQIIILKEENEEKDIMIKCLLDQIQEIQDNYVTAEKKIQDLRFKLYQAQYQGNITCRSNKKKFVLSPKTQSLSNNNGVTFATLMSNSEKNHYSLPFIDEKEGYTISDNEHKKKIMPKEFSQMCETNQKIIPNMIVEPCECWDSQFDEEQKFKNTYKQKGSIIVPPLYIKDENSSELSILNSNEISWEDTCGSVSNISESLEIKDKQFVNLHSDTYNTSSTSYKTLQFSMLGDSVKYTNKNLNLIYQRSFINNIQRRKCGKRIRNSLSELLSKHFKIFKKKSNELFTDNQYINGSNIQKQTTMVESNQIKNVPRINSLELNRIHQLNEDKDINIDTVLLHAEEMKKISESLKIFLIMNLKLK